MVKKIKKEIEKIENNLKNYFKKIVLKKWLLFKRTKIVKCSQFSRLLNETVEIPRIVILKPRILYDLDLQPSKIRNLWKDQISFSSYEKYKLMLPTHEKQKHKQ